ncbi:MAG: hypothetical protein ACI4EI_01900 [Muricoprocola sp.]
MKRKIYPVHEKGELRMLGFLFTIGMLWVFGKLLLIGIKAAWGISKFLLTVVLLPVILIGMVIGGLIYLAVPILLVIGIVVFISSRA